MEHKSDRLLKKEPHYPIVDNTASRLVGIIGFTPVSINM